MCIKLFKRKVLFITSLIILYLAFPLCAQLPKISIMDLSSKSLNQDRVRAVTDKIASELFKTGYFDIVERVKLIKILEEQALGQSGALNDDQAAAAGKLLGVRKILMGTVEYADKTYVLSLRFVDVETARITNMLTREFRGNFKKFLEKGVKRIITEFAGSTKTVSVEFSFVVARDGKTGTVKSGDTLMTGDLIHITIRPNQRCYVYVVNQDARGNVYSLFPNPTQRYKALSEGEEYHIPEKGSSFELDEVAGTEYIYFTASAEPVADIEKLLFREEYSAAQKKELLDHIQTRGFAKIKKGDETEIPLDKGITFKGNMEKLMGDGSFQYRVEFEHVRRK